MTEQSCAAGLFNTGARAGIGVSAAITSLEIIASILSFVDRASRKRGTSNTLRPASARTCPGDLSEMSKGQDAKSEDRGMGRNGGAESSRVELGDDV